MTTELAAALDVEPWVDETQAASVDVQSSYDGSNVVFRLLRMETWGPTLMNLGYHRYSGPLTFLNVLGNLELAQRRLVINAIELLGIDPGHRVLDVACGRGKSSFIVHCLQPQARVVGLDLLPDHVHVARTVFDQIENLSYVAGSAQNLDFSDASFDRVLCLEAAFHFPDRVQFLREASRVLKPGGRLIVVDFAWNNDHDRAHRDDAETRLVREIWQWTDLSSIREYSGFAGDLGLRTVTTQDWSHRVTGPIQSIFRFLSTLGNSRWGRKFLLWRNPLYRSFSHEDWKQIARAVRAHDHVQQYSKYMAFVFEKPK